MFINRYEKLKSLILKEVNGDIIKTNTILGYINKYESDNINTIKKLKKERVIDAKKINGAIIQTINVHGNITKKLSGSATKRIVGSMLVSPKKEKHKYYIVGLFVLLGLLGLLSFLSK